MNWNVAQNGWLLRAWRNLGSTAPLPPQIDPVLFLLESRFPSSLSADSSEEVGRSRFEERFTSVLEIGYAIISRKNTVQTPDDSERMAFLGLAAALGEEATMTALMEADGPVSEGELRALEMRLARLQNDGNIDDVDNPFKQLIWRREATRFAFTLQEICDGTFSPLTALMGHKQELQTRRLMLQLFASVIEAETCEDAHKRYEAHVRTLTRASDTEDHVMPQPVDADLLKNLAARITNTGDRLLLLAEIFFIAYLNGTLTDEEVKALETIGDALQISAERRLELQSAVLHRFQIDTDLRPGFSFGALIDRTRKSTAKTVEKIITKNAVAIANELRETGDLMQLMAKSTSEKLSEDEQIRMKEQIHDLCRAVPCLALFAAPGGSLLIPVLQRLLPINILPSSFADKETAPTESDRDTKDDLEAVKIV